MADRGTDLSGFDFTPSLLLRKCEDPDKFGVREEVIAELLPALFATLDLGRNRSDLTAWKCLHEALKRVESRPELIRPHFERRKSWWPAFHSNEVDVEVKRIRKKCFKRLNATL